MSGEYDGQRSRIRAGGVEVVKRVPARSRGFRKLRDARVQRRPASEVCKALGRFALHRFLEPAHRFITNVGDEIHVDLSHSVGEQKVTYLVQHVAVVPLPDETDAQAHVEQYADSIRIEPDSTCEVLCRYAFFASVGNDLQYAEPQDRNARLKSDRRECEFLRLRNCFECGQFPRLIVADHRWTIRSPHTNEFSRSFQ